MRPYVWKKVIANSGYNGVSAVMRLKVKEVFGDTVSVLKLGLVNPLPVKKIRDFLDGASCTPYVDYTPGQIEEIVTEEISAFLGGGADADRCVRNIQSRVKIWLAEHR